MSGTPLNTGETSPDRDDSKTSEEKDGRVKEEPKFKFGASPPTKGGKLAGKKPKITFGGGSSANKSPSTSPKTRGLQMRSGTRSGAAAPAGFGSKAGGVSPEKTSGLVGGVFGGSKGSAGGDGRISFSFGALPRATSDGGSEKKPVKGKSGAVAAPGHDAAVVDVYGADEEKFCSILAEMMSGMAGEEAVKYGTHAVRGLLYGGATNSVPGSFQSMLVRALKGGVSTSLACAHNIIYGLTLVSNNDSFVARVFREMRKIPAAAPIAKVVLNRQELSPLLMGVVPSFEGVREFFDEGCFLEYLCMLVLGRCGGEMQQVGVQASRGVLFGGDLNPISDAAKQKYMDRLVALVRDGSEGQAAVDLLRLVEKNSYLVHRTLMRLMEKDECRVPVLKAMGRHVETVLGINEADEDSILKVAREGNLDLAIEAIETALSHHSNPHSLQNCFLHESLWRLVVHKIPLLKRTALALVSETEHWQQVFCTIAPSLNQKWGEGDAQVCWGDGKRDAILEALQNSPDGPSVSSVISSKPLAPNIAFAALTSDVMDAGMPDEAEWMEVSDEAKRLIRQTLLKRSDAVRFFRDTMQYAGAEEEEDVDMDRLEASAVRAVFWKGLRGRVLAPKGSAVLRILDNRDVVSEIESFVVGPDRMDMRDRLMLRTRCLRKHWVTMAEPDEIPPCEWWAAALDDRPLLQRIVTRATKHGRPLQMIQALHAAAVTNATTTAEYLIRKGVPCMSDDNTNHYDSSSRYCGDQCIAPPINTAAHFNAVDVVKLMLRIGTDDIDKDKEEKDDDDDDEEEGVDVLHPNGFVVRVAPMRPIDRNRALRNALNSAALNAHGDVIRVLLKEEPSLAHGPILVNATEGRQHLPNRPDAVHAFLEFGADINVRGHGGNTPLLNAARRGNVEVLRMLIDNGADIKAVDDDGFSALTFAIERNAMDCVELLLERGVDIVGDAAGTFPPLHRAARVGLLSVVKMLLDRGVEVDITDGGGQTALMSACHGRHTETVRYLLDHGANPNHPREDGMTPVMAAAASNAHEALKLMIDRGADVNVEDEDGLRAILFAARSGHLNCVRALVEAGADVNVTDPGNHSALLMACEQEHEECAKYLAENGADPNVTCVHGGTPLLTIFNTNVHADTLRVLLDKGADASKIGPNNYNPLLMALSSSSAEVARLLLENGAKPNVTPDGAPPAMIIALDSDERLDKAQLLLEHGFEDDILDDILDELARDAIEDNHVGLLRAVLERGLDVESKGPEENLPTLLAYATENDKPECIRVLLEYGADTTSALSHAAANDDELRLWQFIRSKADLNRIDEDGNTALMAAARANKPTFVQLILENGGDINCQGKFGRTALVQAAKSGSFEALEKLLAAGADCNIQTTSGRTALHEAALHGQVPCIDALIAHGADIHATDNEGRSVLMYAARFGQVHILQSLLRRGARINDTDNYDRTALVYATRANNQECIQFLLDNDAEGEEEALQAAKLRSFPHDLFKKTKESKK